MLYLLIKKIISITKHKRHVTPINKYKTIKNKIFVLVSLVGGIHHHNLWKIGNARHISNDIG